METDIARIRRFNRAVTVETGALDTSFLGRGRPLGAARVLNAIGQGIGEGAALRAYLGLDSGLLSRLLRGLEAEGLIYTTPDPTDRRRRTARLTPAGEAEFATYERLSDDRARALLARHPNRADLLAAMDLIATALTADRIEIAEADPESAPVRACLSQYYAELARRFDMGYDPALAADPEAAAMRPPRGSFLLASSDGTPVGCVGLKGGTSYAEVKRLWVAPSARRLGLARRLMEALEARARTLDLATLRLDTNSALPEAEALYRTTGWTEIDRFNDDPYPDLFFEKRLEISPR